jgi:hypothetical protein
VKDFGVMLDTILYFLSGIFSGSIDIRVYSFYYSHFSSFDSPLFLCIALIRSKVVYTFVVWNNFTSSD